jgi:hypothetical protein
MDSERGKGSPWVLVSLAVATVNIALTAQSTTGLHLPPQAVVIERAAIPKDIHQDRELVLWMVSPQRHDGGHRRGLSSYTCPERTLGSYYSGPTRISLVDTSAKSPINTLSLRHAGRGEDSFDIPYRILAGYYYLVPGHESGFEGRPALLALRDLNGDGLPLETAFFEAQACMGLETTLIGYSAKRDRVIQYEVELKISEQKTVEGRGTANTGKATIETDTWVDYLFAEKPSRPGMWSYKIDYTGRGGDLESYHVHYDPSAEKFFGRLSTLTPPPPPQ